MPKKLTAQQQVFHDAYRETHNAATAYRRAGYVQDRQGVTKLWLQQRASQVLNTQSMQHALVLSRQETKQRNQITVDWVRDSHTRLMEGAEKRKDWKEARANLEDLGKIVGAYTNELTVITAQRKEYDEAEALEARKLSKLLLTNTIDVEAVQVDEKAPGEDALPPKGAGPEES